MAMYNRKKVLSVVQTQFVPAIYQEKTITPQNFTPVITADSGYNGLSKVKLDGVLVDPHQAYTTSSDTTTAYQKSVPSGALSYATLDKIGGMSYKYNQLVDSSKLKATETINGITITNNGDGSFTLNGTATAFVNYIVSTDTTTTIISGNKYLLYGAVGGSSSTFWLIDSDSNQSDYGSGVIYSSTSNGNIASALRIRVQNGVTLTNATITPQLFDLTDIFGSGNEPSSVETAQTELLKRGIDITQYNEYNTGTIRNSAVTSVVGEETKAIPSEVQALEGYGWGINDTCYNFINVENKKFVKNVNRVDLGTLNWNAQGTLGCYYTTLPNMATQSDSYSPNLLCDKYSYHYTGYAQMNDFEYRLDGNYVGFKNTSYTDAISFKQSLQGEYLYYEVNTPVETDISEYINDEFKYLEVDDNIIFANTYQQAVPSEVTYLVEV